MSLEPSRAAAPVSPRVLVGLFIIGFVTVSFEVVLTRLFSAFVYDDLHYFPLSLALLGASAGALSVQIRRLRYRGDFEALCSKHLFRSVWASLLYALAFIVVLHVDAAALERLVEGVRTEAVDASRDTSEVTLGAIQLTFFRSRLVALACYAAISVVPFFQLGVVLALSFRAYAAQSHYLYLIELTGAAAGAAAAPALLGVLSSLNFLFYVPVLLLVAATLWDASRWKYLAPLALVFVFLQLQPPIVLKTKTLRAHVERLQQPVYEWTAGGLLEGGTPETASWVVNQDQRSSAYVAVYDPSSRTRRRVEESLWIRAAMAMRRPDSVCVLAAGVGPQMIDAHASGVDAVTGVEMNPRQLPFVNRHFPHARLDEFMQLPKVRYIADEARHFLRADKRSYDVIAVPPGGGEVFDRLSRSSYLFTEEAVADLLSRLSPLGIAIIWKGPALPILSDPSKLLESKRLVSMIAAGMQRASISPEGNVLYLSGTSAGPLLFLSRTSFSDEERASLLVLLKAEENTGTSFQVATWSDMQASVAGAEPEPRRVTDDFPYFFRISPVDSAVFRSLGAEPGSLGEMTKFLQAFSNVLGLAFLLPLLLGPLFRRARRPAFDDSAWLLYFFCTGAGFMFFEIPLIEKLVFTLGHPTRSIAFCLASLLLGTGMGSLLAARIVTGSGEQRRFRVRLWFAVILAVEVLLYVGIGPLQRRLPDLSVTMQYILAALVPLGLGAVLGLPFPEGIARLEQQSRPLVAWAWALNGMASVLAINLASLAIGVFPVSSLFLVGIAFYAGSFVLFERATLPA